MVVESYKKRKIKKEKAKKIHNIRMNILRVLMLIVASIALYATYWTATYESPQLPPGTYRIKCIDGSIQTFNKSTLLVCGQSNPLSKNDEIYRINISTR